VCLKNHLSIIHDRSSSDDTAMHYVLPVLWMTSCFHTMGQTQIQDWSLRRSELSTMTRQMMPLNCAPSAKSAIADCFVTGSIARSAKHRYLSYSEADFEAFRPARATRCADGVKFGGERRYCSAVYAIVGCPSVCLYVCLSVTHSNVSDQLSTSSRNQRQTMSHRLCFMMPKILMKPQWGQMLLGWVNCIFYQSRVVRFRRPSISIRCAYAGVVIL